MAQDNEMLDYEIDRCRNKIKEINSFLPQLTQKIASINDSKAYIEAMLDFSEAGKECFIQGAGYWGQEVAESGYFDMLSDYLENDLMVEIDKITSSIEDLASKCDDEIRRNYNIISYNESKKRQNAINSETKYVV